LAAGSGGKRKAALSDFEPDMGQNMKLEL